MKEKYLERFAYGYPAVQFIEKNYANHTVITREENFYILQNNYIPIFQYQIQKLNKNLFFNTSNLKNNEILIVINIKNEIELKGIQKKEVDHILKNHNICVKEKFYKSFNASGRSFYTAVSAKFRYLFIEGFKSANTC